MSLFLLRNACIFFTPIPLLGRGLPNLPLGWAGANVGCELGPATAVGAANAGPIFFSLLIRH